MGDHEHDGLAGGAVRDQQREGDDHRSSSGVQRPTCHGSSSAQMKWAIAHTRRGEGNARALEPSLHAKHSVRAQLISFFASSACTVRASWEYATRRAQESDARDATARVRVEEGDLPPAVGANHAQVPRRLVPRAPAQLEDRREAAVVVGISQSPTSMAKSGRFGPGPEHSSKSFSCSKPSLGLSR